VGVASDDLNIVMSGKIVLNPDFKNATLCVSFQARDDDGLDDAVSTRGATATSSAWRLLKFKNRATKAASASPRTFPTAAANVDIAVAA
jgi:hypothetical protein